jgi:hypothetical protein
MPTDANQAVDHIDHDADVIGNDAHDLTDLGPSVAAGQIEKAVLLGEGADLGLWVLDD